MKHFLLLILLSSLTSLVFSQLQRSDFIVLKKKNNRTIKTYAEGSFISATTQSGFPLNGFIKRIHNDSIYVQQQQLELTPTEFGTRLDTLTYTMGMHYSTIKKFNFSSRYRWGGKKGFTQVVLPKIMILGGIGFIVLEGVNSIYRKESFNDSKKLASLGIAAGVAGAGFLWAYLKSKSNIAGKAYKVIYMKMPAPVTGGVQAQP